MNIVKESESLINYIEQVNLIKTDVEKAKI